MFKEFAKGFCWAAGIVIGFAVTGKVVAILENALEKKPQQP